jgi:hypothetical protein
VRGWSGWAARTAVTAALPLGFRRRSMRITRRSRGRPGHESTAVGPLAGDDAVDDDGLWVDKLPAAGKSSVLETLVTLLEIEGVEFGALEPDQLGWVALALGRAAARPEASRARAAAPEPGGADFDRGYSGTSEELAGSAVRSSPRGRCSPRAGLSLNPTAMTTCIAESTSARRRRRARVGRKQSRGLRGAGDPHRGEGIAPVGASAEALRRQRDSATRCG